MVGSIYRRAILVVSLFPKGSSSPWIRKWVGVGMIGRERRINICPRVY